MVKQEGGSIISNNTLKPTDDWVFQLIFGNVKQKDVTDNFINAIFNEIKVTPPFNIIDIKSEFPIGKLDGYKKKHIRLDVLAEYSNHIVSIEMQNSDKYNIYERTRYYFSKICGNQLNIGNGYKALKPVTMINILNYIPKDFNFPDHLQNLIVVDDRHRDMEIDFGIKFIYIFLPLLNKNVSLNYDNPFIQWLTFLKYKDKGVIQSMCQKNTSIKTANDVLNKISAEEEERRFQRAVEGGQTDLIFAKMKAFQDGKADGEAEGERIRYV